MATVPAPNLSGWLRATAARPPRAALIARLALLMLWLAAVVVLARGHVVWRDEVRALSLATSGDGFGGMVAAVRGEGHPLLWYALLRAGFAAGLSVAVLPVAALAVAAASAALLVLRAPFGLAGLTMLLASRFFVIEYSVVARNYGLAMLLLFAIAAFYPQLRRHGAVLGLLLALLANSSVHAALLAIAFAGFWALDLGLAEGWRRSWRELAGGAAMLGLGLAICAASLFPTVNDAAVASVNLDRSSLARFALLRGFDFAWPSPWPRLLLAGAIAGLLRHPPAAIALVSASFMLSGLFSFVYPGYYRHSALIIVFAVTLYWIVLARERAVRDAA